MTLRVLRLLFFIGYQSLDHELQANVPTTFNINLCLNFGDYPKVVQFSKKDKNLVIGEFKNIFNPPPLKKNF